VTHKTAYANPIHWTFANPVLLSFLPAIDKEGIVVSGGVDGCTEPLGILNKKYLDDILTSLTIPYLQSINVIGPKKLAAFLLRNVTEDPNNGKPALSNASRGYHQATGKPLQTYAVMDYDTTGLFGQIHDTSPASHEIAEWMNDPLNTNLAPPWNQNTVAKLSQCKNYFEVGDPLVGSLMPVIKLDDYQYHVQELAFFSWFYNGKDNHGNIVPSIGAGGEYSGRGTFGGPSKICPTGGYY
jgi:hypothetical protein